MHKQLFAPLKADNWQDTNMKLKAGSKENTCVQLILTCCNYLIIPSDHRKCNKPSNCQAGIASSASLSQRKGSDQSVTCFFLNFRLR